MTKQDYSTYLRYLELEAALLRRLESVELVHPGPADTAAVERVCAEGRRAFHL